MGRVLFDQPSADGQGEREHKERRQGQDQYDQAYRESKTIAIPGKNNRRRYRQNRNSETQAAPYAQSIGDSASVHLVEINLLAFPACALSRRGRQLWSPEFGYLANGLHSDRFRLATALSHQLPTDRTTCPMRTA